jgi:hypothetical protein
MKSDPEPGESPTTSAALTILIEAGDDQSDAGRSIRKRKLLGPDADEEPTAAAKVTVLLLTGAKKRIDVNESKSRKRGVTALIATAFAAVAIALTVYFSITKASFILGIILAVTLGGAIGFFASVFRLQGARAQVDRLLAIISGQLLASGSHASRNHWTSEDDNA